jgi:2-dehydro-3-deoxyphosphogluconate aldolase/(4S)-4-hydroxy-2-oxoglutarate aldolase
MIRTCEEVRQRILETGILPVIRAPKPSLAIAAARAIGAGGIPIVEITMTVPGAIDVIAELTATTGMLVGAGTVLDVETARRCIEAGAEFLVSPILDSETVKLAQRERKLVMAGGLTPVEVVDAWRNGSDFVKVFPCGNMGGPSYLRTLKTVLPQIEMIPTGGVNLANMPSFFEAGAAAVGIGGELVSMDALLAGNFDAIAEDARRYATVAREMSVARQMNLAQGVKHENAVS